MAERGIKKQNISFWLTTDELEFVKSHPDINFSKLMRGMLDTYIQNFNENAYIQNHKTLYLK